jgi:hypothetical protein
VEHEFQRMIHAVFHKSCGFYASAANKLST